MPDSFLFPSTALDATWLGLTSPRQAFTSTDASGKWLIFRPSAMVDQAWIQVLALISTGGLICAKVSTRRGIVLGGYADHVICVYTRDWRDTEDVMKVRGVLRVAGFVEVLRYKRDLDTRLGIERFVYEV
ncbi:MULTISPECIES: putative phosphothreonine lyase domain-containg protein [Ramlibacter]|nr:MULTISPECIES: putative phosphothreonine lyase domain-containg protein [Ramlibacter]MBA2960512.1 DUF1917 domain-containing protein [Ramlibacter sp. CGMCC 1.13660]